MKRTDLEFMPDFYDRYIYLVDENMDLIEALNGTEDVFENLRSPIIQFQEYRYQPEKWTPKEVLQHIIDNERIMAYRALCLSREEKQELIGYDQDDYTTVSNAANKSMEALLKEFKLVRQTTVLLFEGFTKEMFLKKGMCSGIEVSPLALGLVIAGHPIHHINVLKERYFNK